MLFFMKLSKPAKIVQLLAYKTQTHLNNNFARDQVVLKFNFIKIAFCFNILKSIKTIYVVRNSIVHILWHLYYIFYKRKAPPYLRNMWGDSTVCCFLFNISVIVFFLFHISFCFSILQE